MYHKGRLTLILGIVITVLTSACGKSDVKPDEPPVETTPIAVTPLADEPLNLISLRLDEIRLTPKAEGQNLFVSSVWMIPINEAGDTTGARLVYSLDNALIPITATAPYEPPSDWFLTIEREALANKDFGMWFMVTGADGEEGTDWQVLQAEFESLMSDALPIIVNSAATVILSYATPGVLDEALAGEAAITATATRGPALMAHIASFGRESTKLLREILTESRPEMSDLIEQRLDDGVLNRIFGALDDQEYFGEAYIRFSATEDYRLNNRFSIVTTDGSLEIVFSVFATSNDPAAIASFEPESPTTTYVPAESCNPDNPSTLIPGKPAEILARTQRVTSSLMSSTGTDFMVTKGDTVYPIMAFCDRDENAMWWRVKAESGEVGWMPENHGEIVYASLKK